MINGHTLYLGIYPKNHGKYGIWYDGENDSPDWIRGLLKRLPEKRYTKGLQASDSYAECPDQVIEWKEYIDRTWTSLGETNATVRCLDEGIYNIGFQTAILFTIYKY